MEPMVGGRREASARRHPASDPTPIRAPHARSRRKTVKQKKSRRGRGHAAEAAGSSGAGANGGGGGGGDRRFGFGRVFYWGAVLGLWAIIAAIGVVVWVGAHLPPIQSLEIPKRPPSIQIAGSDGRVLVTRGDMGAEAVALKELPNYLPKAFVAIEDRRFYAHYGVDPMGVARAAGANVLRRSVQQGGSTITQQLAKNLFLTQERTWFRKIQELVLALWLERKFSKAEILELYLNRIYFGAGAYGIEAAAQRYFNKSARQLTLAEAAMLAGLVKSPSRLAPTRNPDGAQRRAQTVLTAMAETKLITGPMAKLAMAQPARAVKPAGAGSINYVADWIMDVLDDLIGRVEQDIVVVTSIDPALQAAAEKALVDELAQRGEKFDVEQGAVVAMTPDGAVRALVGGRNYAESQFNRAVAAKRQPGSAFKPFVYLAALERGLTPETVRDDRPINVKGWRPENYTREYFGPVTLTQAFAHSLNTVSVRLTLEFGAADVGAHRAPARHCVQTGGQYLDRARHLGSLADRADRRVRGVRQWRRGGDAACGRAGARRRRQGAVCAGAAKSRPRGRAAACRDDERDDAGDAADRHRAQGRARRLAGGGKDRNQPGFPRRLVHRLHRQPGDRRLARQRRQLATAARPPAAACRWTSGADS